MQRVTHAATRPRLAAFTRRLARSAKVTPSPVTWEITEGPWYDNNLAILELRDATLRMWWSAGEVVDEQYDRPALRRVATVDVPG
jgi:hypothetical protein